jgi:hypothetical protein
MARLNWKEIAELAGLAAVIASLVLVAYELRQSTAVASAQAVTELSATVDSAYRARAQDAVLDDLVTTGHNSPSNLSERQRSQFNSWLRADMNGLEAAWFYYDKGILSQEDFDGYEAAICSRVATAGGTKWWEAEAEFFASGFRESVNEWCF